MVVEGDETGRLSLPAGGEGGEDKEERKTGQDARMWEGGWT